MSSIFDPSPTGIIPVLQELESTIHAQEELHYDAQSVVEPYQLCRYCQTLVAKLEPVLLELRHGETSSKLLPHYPGIHELVHGAREGCHLCSKLLSSRRRVDSGRLVPKSPPEVYEKDIHTQVSYTTWRQPMSYEIVIGQISNTTHKLDHLTYPIFLDFEPHLTASSKHAQISRYTGSAACYQMIQEWLNTCTSLHQQCNVVGPLRRPTRVLDLMFDDTSDVRLVAGNSVAAPYATLSYSWGTSEQLMLVSGNHKAFQRRIRFPALSKTSQGAVTVCRGLSIRYLWIDAMCIVQGVDGDFISESARMRDIYAGSIVTITAAVSNDTSQPFLAYREPLQYMDCKLSTLHMNGYEGNVKDLRVCGSEACPGKYHIDTRAWCFQERFLSPRSVYFGLKGIHWECRMGVACEHQSNVDDHDIHPRIKVYHTEGEILKAKYATLLSLRGSLNNPHIAFTIRDIWNLVLRFYTGMQLTRLTDRLVAIAGVASVLETKFHMRAVFGLWLDFFMEELLWTVNSKIRHCASTTKQAPSWSWANMNCRINASCALLSGQRHGEALCLEVISRATMVFVPPETGFCVVRSELSIKPAMRLRGKLVPCTFEQHSRGPLVLFRLIPRPPDSDETVVSDNTVETINGGGDNYDVKMRPTFRVLSRKIPMCNMFQPDTKDSLIPSLHCLHLRSELRRQLYAQDRHDLYNYGLVLKTTENSEETMYERVGVFYEIFGNVNFEELPEGLPRFKVQTEAQYLWKDAGAEEEVVIV